MNFIISGTINNLCIIPGCPVNMAGKQVGLVGIWKKKRRTTVGIEFKN